MEDLYLEKNQLENTHSKLSNKSVVVVFGILVLAIVSFYFLFLRAPSAFEKGTTVRVEQGMGLRSVSYKLKNENIIRSRLLFEIFVILYGGEKHIKYADYLLEEKLPVYEVARRIAKGEHHMAPVSVTIPEGYTVKEIADTVATKLLNFNKQNFLALATPSEGYLFPDTYFFLNIADERDVLALMKSNFEKKVEPLRPSILQSGKSEKDIILMASIVEGEAKGDQDRAFIAGILWHRISIGMPLQVDVAPETYKSKGLPKTPVGNPGILAIKATINPEKSAYLYYLHDKDGNIHYAKTFEEHKLNKSKYLK